MIAADLPSPDTRRLHAARQAAARGMPVVGLVGAVAPVELVSAAGCFPVHLMAHADDFSSDPAPMEAGHEPEIRSLFTQAVRGDFDTAGAIVVPSTSDGYRYLYPYLKEMRRRGLCPHLPSILPFDFLFGASAAVRQHSMDSMRELGSRLAGLSGRAASDDRLHQAIECGNALRQQLRHLHQLRLAAKVTGTLAHAATRSTAFWDEAASAQVLADALQAWVSQAPLTGRPRWLLVSAVPLYHECLHALLEAAGGLVVADDDEWGARRAAPDVDSTLPPLTALFEHLARHAVSPRMLQDEREAWLRTQLRGGEVDGVVFYMPPSDQHFGWRYPDLAALAATCGKPSVLIRHEALDAQAAAAIHQQAAAFAETCKSRQNR